MNTEPKTPLALRLAGILEQNNQKLPYSAELKAAIELRRLHDRVAELERDRDKWKDAALLAADDKAGGDDEAVAYLKAETTLPKYRGWAVCEDDDPNGFPVYTRPQPQAEAVRDISHQAAAVFPLDALSASEPEQPETMSPRELVKRIEAGEKWQVAEHPVVVPQEWRRLAELQNEMHQVGRRIDEIDAKYDLSASPSPAPAALDAAKPEPVRDFWYPGLSPEEIRGTAKPEQPQGSGKRAELIDAINKLESRVDEPGRSDEHWHAREVRHQVWEILQEIRKASALLAAGDKALRSQVIPLSEDQRKMLSVTGDVRIPGADKAGGEVVAWRDWVEQRLLTWRQSKMNRSGDRLALDDFMDKTSLDDLIDYVCSEYEGPSPARPQPQAEAVCVPDGWREALQFYADGNHFVHDEESWDTVSGEPTNFWCDEAETATVEDGTVAAMALRGTPLRDEDDAAAPKPQEPGA